MKRFVQCQTQREFIHCWPEAPEEVKFLRDPHRHMLHIRVKIAVYHDDRDIEFIMLKHKVNTLLLRKFPDRTSCEQVGEYLIEELQYFYGKRHMEVEISEDGENSAIIESEE